MAYHSLDAVSFKIDAPVPADRRDPVGAWRDDEANARLDEIERGGALSYPLSAIR